MTATAIAGDLLLRGRESSRAPKSADGKDDRKSDFSCFLSQKRTNNKQEKTSSAQSAPDNLLSSDKKEMPDLVPMVDAGAVLSIMTADRNFFQQLMPATEENSAEAPVNSIQTLMPAAGGIDLMPAREFIQRILDQKQQPVQEEAPDPATAKGEPVPDFKTILDGKTDKKAIGGETASLKNEEPVIKNKKEEIKIDNASGEKATADEKNQPKTKMESLISRIAESIKTAVPENHQSQKDLNETVMSSPHQNKETAASFSLKSSEADLTEKPMAVKENTLPLDTANRINGEYRPDAGAVVNAGIEKGIQRTDAVDTAATLTELPRRIADVVRDYTAGNIKDGKVEIRLDPPQLGKVSISLSLENGVLSSKFTCSDEAGTVIKDNMSNLRISLAQQGITLGESTVSSRRENNSGNYPSHDSYSRKNRKSEDRIEASTSTPQDAFHRGSQISCLV